MSSSNKDEDKKMTTKLFSQVVDNILNLDSEDEEDYNYGRKQQKDSKKRNKSAEKKANVVKDFKKMANEDTDIKDLSDVC